MVCCRFDSSRIRSRLDTLTVQHVSLLDMLFMSGKHPRVRSMVVSVFSFTLLGNVVQPCAVDQFGGPFLAYLREDDDHESFAARLRALSGDSEEDLDRCRLAVVKDRRPTFIRRPTAGQTISRLGSSTRLASSDSLVSCNSLCETDLDEDASAQAQLQQAVPKKDQTAGQESLWELFAAKYPEFVECDFSLAVSSAKNKKSGYPQLGIQRSASEAFVNK